MGSITSRAVWFLLAVILGSVAALFSVQAYRAFTSKNWPVTNGVVVAFYETPQYRYSVGGRTYTNGVASCNEFWSSYVAIRNSSKYAVRYPLNGTVKVHYHPKKPELAVLETQFDSSVLLPIGGMLFFGLICFLGFLFGWPLGSRSSLSWLRETASILGNATLDVEGQEGFRNKRETDP